MAWFRREKYTTIKPPAKRLNIPEGLWHKCPSCNAIGSQKDFVEGGDVCTSCGYHSPLSSERRIELLFDEGSFEETNQGLVSADPLGFVDRVPYPERVQKHQEKSGLEDAVRTGLAKLDGQLVSIAVMDFGFIGGSMGSVVGEKVTRAIELGLERKIPVIVVCQSGGARMQEGSLSLMQMAKTSAALARLGEAGVPYISILTNPTTAGVMASFASLGDVIIAEPDALIGFAGPRVIEQTINQILPKGFQRSEFVRDHGFIDIVCHRSEMREKLTNVVNVLRSNLKTVKASRTSRVKTALKQRTTTRRKKTSTPKAALAKKK